VQEDVSQRLYGYERVNAAVCKWPPV
jgi:hypothetical protein